MIWSFNYMKKNHPSCGNFRRVHEIKVGSWFHVILQPYASTDDLFVARENVTWVTVSHACIWLILSREAVPLILYQHIIICMDPSSCNVYCNSWQIYSTDRRVVLRCVTRGFACRFHSGDSSDHADYHVNSQPFYSVAADTIRSVT